MPEITLNEKNFPVKEGKTSRDMPLASADLSADYIDVSLKSDASILNTQKNDQIAYFEGERKRGTYYVQRITRKDEVLYSVFGYSAVGLLLTITHYGGIYNGITAGELIREICGSVPVVVKSSLVGVKLYGWLPYTERARDNLNQVLFALGAYLTTDRNGVLHVEPLWSGETGAIPASHIYMQGASVEYENKVSAVSVTEHQYIEGTEEAVLFSGTAQDGDVITFSGPMHSLAATGFTILESGANYAVLSPGTGVLTGKRYIHNTRLIIRAVNDGVPENIQSVTDATLVSLVNSGASADRLAAYYKCRETINAAILSGAERPGHVVKIWHPYDRKMVSACISSLDTTMSATLKGQLTALVGFQPPVPDVGYINSRIVLTGSGVVQLPPGVTSVRYVLIGGAQGGRAGKKGESGTAQAFSFSVSGWGGIDRYQGYRPGPGGAGGEGGEPGHGGRILQGDLEFEDGASLQYSCGVGGAGAVFDAENQDAEGTEGTATVLAGLTSDSGSFSDAGYVDVLTGDVYAAAGLHGIPGGKGGGNDDSSVNNENAFTAYSAESATDENGTVWPGGSMRMADGGVYLYSESDNVHDRATSEAASVGAYSSTTPGGGAAAGAAGTDGWQTPGAASATQSSSTNVITAIAGTRPGVNGASAVLIPKKAANGNGGRGGYGGGGGGSIGWSAIRTSGNVVSTVNSSNNSAAPGVGGDGAQGGEGGDGLIILYYSTPNDASVKPFVTRNQRWFLDATRRRLIV